MARSSVRLIYQAHPNLNSVEWIIKCHLNDFFLLCRPSMAYGKVKRCQATWEMTGKLVKG